MTPAQILQWAQVGVQLIQVLGVPITNVIRLFREAGGTDAEAELLVQHWSALGQSVEARIAVLKSQGAGG